MRISDWSSDVCSSDLGGADEGGQRGHDHSTDRHVHPRSPHLVRRLRGARQDRPRWSRATNQIAGIGTLLRLGGYTVDMDRLPVATFDRPAAELRRGYRSAISFPRARPTAAAHPEIDQLRVLLPVSPPPATLPCGHDAAPHGKA